MKTKNLYTNFKKDKRIYNLNQGYWKKKLQKVLNKELHIENILFDNIDLNNNKIYDANPIYTYLDKNEKKAIRIIQDDIDQYIEERIDINNISNIQLLISAWLDTIVVYDKNDEEIKVDELVIVLLLTNETIDISMKLIQKWLSSKIDENCINSIIRNYSISDFVQESYKIEKYLDNKYSYFLCFINLDKYKRYDQVLLKDRGYVGEWNISNNKSFDKLLIYVRDGKRNSLYEASYVSRSYNIQTNKTRIFFKDFKFITDTTYNWIELTGMYNSFKYYNID
jgi:hypothetical protein